MRGLIDTRASAISMSTQIAKQMGVAFPHGDKTIIVTARGTKFGYVVTVDAVAVGNITLRDAKVSISDPAMPLLICTSVQKRINVDIRGSNMTLAMC